MASPSHEDHHYCGGRSPGYWKQCQHFSEWPVTAPSILGCTNGTPSQPSAVTFGSGASSPGESFYPTFSSAATLLPVVAPTTGRTISMWEILAFPNPVASASGTATEIVQLARHLIAAYFNAMVVSDYPITPAQVLGMWAHGVGGNYCPIGPCQHPWGPSELICYLKRTFDLVGFGPDDYNGITCP